MIYNTTRQACISDYSDRHQSHAAQMSRAHLSRVFANQSHLEVGKYATDGTNVRVGVVRV